MVSFKNFSGQLINFNLVFSTIETISRFNIYLTFFAYHCCTDSTTHSFLNNTQTNNVCQKFICINHFNIKSYQSFLFDRYIYLKYKLAFFKNKSIKQIHYDIFFLILFLFLYRFIRLCSLNFFFFEFKLLNNFIWMLFEQMF